MRCTALQVIFGRLWYHHTSSRATMSTSTPTTSRSDLGSIFDTAFQAYKKNTGNDITTHPLATELQSSRSPDAVIAVLRNQVSVIGQDSEGFLKRLIPTVNVLYEFSATLGEGVGLVNRTMPRLVEKIYSDICLSGILTRQGDFCGNRCSPPGRSFLVPYRGLFSCRSFSRRLKMSALAEKLSCICSTAWNPFSAASRLTPWCHSPRV